MQEHEFSNLIEEIVKEEFPSETFIYEISGKELINDIYAGRSIKTKQKKGEINFLEEGKDIVALVSLIASTYKMCKEIVQFFKTKKVTAPTKDEICISWKKLMVQEGISQVTAEKIAAKYSEQLLKPIYHAHSS